MDHGGVLRAIYARGVEAFSYVNPTGHHRRRWLEVTEAPKPSDIQNVFGLNKPQHMLSKLLWEIDNLSRSLSVWTKRGEFPEPLFIAYNAAVTAWHITDWLWQSSPEIRTILAKRYALIITDSSAGLRKGLEKFQESVAKESRHLYACREIANGSKHMRRRRSDPDISAEARWHRAIQGAGHVKPGDLMLSLVIKDGTHEESAERWFIQAFGYWEQLFTKENLIAVSDRLPDKIISRP